MSALHRISRRGAGQVRYIAEPPGGRAEDIATALGTETAELRPALMKLRSAGAVEPKGKARATRYYASAS